MKLSDGEKLILLMLSELYDKLGVEGEIDPDFLRSAIFSNNIWSIPWKYPGIPFEDERDPEIVKEVLDILEMWSAIERSYQRLSDEEKSHVEKEAEPFGKDPKFSGFDGNYETDYMGIATFLVNDLDRFEEFKGRYLNSHSRSINAYKRMLSTYTLIRERTHYQPLSAKDLVEILQKRTHPSCRE